MVHIVIVSSKILILKQTKNDEKKIVGAILKLRVNIFCIK